MALFAALTLVGIMEGQVPFSHLINAILGSEVHHFGWHVPAFLTIAFTMLVLVLLIRPQGIMGEPLAEKKA